MRARDLPCAAARGQVIIGVRVLVPLWPPPWYLLTVQYSSCFSARLHLYDAGRGITKVLVYMYRREVLWGLDAPLASIPLQKYPVSDVQYSQTCQSMSLYMYE